MSNQAENTKRIAKNTLMLYVRMLVMMFVGLYTSRVILKALGLSDLGLMNVAGGVVGMFTFLNGTLASGTQRFLTFEIGSKNDDRLTRVFQNALTLHAVLAVMIVLLSETVGLWYVCNKLNIEAGRFNAAMWCFQFSVISTVFAIIQIPFSASLIAHEKMGIYAWMSIYDAATKLLGAFLIQITSFDRVIFYSALSLLFGLISLAIYNSYCRKSFQECRFRFGYDKPLFKEMLSFSGWNTIGNLAATGQSTGVNLVINYFCGTVVNGARGIAFQANGWVMKFVDNFQLAMNPQIVKYYAENNIAKMSNLVIKGSQFSSYLLLFLGIPLFIDIEWVITLWLGECPEYVPIFLRIVLVESLFRTIGNPTVTAMHATGQMKWLNISVGSILLLILPISILLFKLGCPVETVVAVNVLPWVAVIPIRLALLKHFCNFPAKEFYLKAVIKTLSLTGLLFILPYLAGIFISLTGVLHFLCIGTISVIWCSGIIYLIGLDKETRTSVNNRLMSLLRR